MTSFLWYIENLNDEPVEVSLMFTWQAGSGTLTLLVPFFSHGQVLFYLASHEFPCTNISHESVDVSKDGLSASGVSIKQVLRDMPLEYCLMGKKEVS